MKKRNTIIMLPVLILIAVLVAVAIYIHANPIIKNPYVQEYLPGTGNIIGDVDVEEFESHGEAYAIGADKDGHAVFKNPHAARKALLRDYKDTIKECQKSGALKGTNFRFFNTDAAAAANLGSDAFFIDGFCDIYENSYEDFSYENES